MRTHLTLFTTVVTLTSSLAAQQLVAIDSSRRIYDIDATTGAKTQIGTISSNAGTTGGLALDPATDTLYLTSTSNDSLYTLDLATGTATLVGAYGSPSFVMHGIEWDSSTGTLYGGSQHDNGLYTIDTTTGAATLIGVSGLTSFVNLGYDSTNDVLYSTNSGTDSFYVVDRSTGAVTLIGALGGPTNPNGLAYAADSDTLYLVDNSQDNLYTIDRTTGVATVIGSTGSGNLLGLVCLGCDGARWREFGTGCTGTAGVPTLTSTQLPLINGTFTSQISNVPVGGIAWGVIGFTSATLGGTVPLPFDLGVLGMTGCQMYSDIVLTVPLNPVAGVASLNLLLPANTLGRRLYQQGYVFDPPANSFGLTVTNGAEVVVGQ